MNEVKIHNLFPVPVFHYKLENYKETNQELLNYILELQKKDKIGNSHSNKGGWHSPNFDIVNEGPPVKFINKIYWRFSFDKIKIWRMPSSFV